MTRLFGAVLTALVALCGGCQNGLFGPDLGRSTRALERSAPCEKWSALAGDVGCALPTACTVADACVEPARAFIDCAAEDLSQCLCEGDDDQLSCAGAFAPSEGPARCMFEHEQFERCQHAAASAYGAARRSTLDPP